MSLKKISVTKFINSFISVYHSTVAQELAARNHIKWQYFCLAIPCLCTWDKHNRKTLTHKILDRNMKFYEVYLKFMQDCYLWLLSFMLIPIYISFLKIKKYSNGTTLSKYIWDTKEKHQETPTLKWSIVKQVPSYSNITKKCLLCLHEKFEILNYPNPVEMLNKRSELISKCRHSNKFLLKIFKSNDWSINKLQKHVMYEIPKDWLVSVV